MLNLDGSLLNEWALFLSESVRSRVQEWIDGFDRRFGTDTAGSFFGAEHNAQSHFYAPTTASLIYEILGSIPLETNKFVFVDMGSGKGRALLIASEFPFKKIVGIELSEKLHRISERNLVIFKRQPQKCTNIVLHCSNVVDYKFCGDPLVLFLFSPFGPEILKNVLENLKYSLISSPREVFVAYINPEFEGILEDSGFLQIVKKNERRWRSWNSYVIYGVRQFSAEGTIADAPAPDASPSLER